MGARVLSGSFAGHSAIVSDASGAFIIPGVGVVDGTSGALILISSFGAFSLTGEPAALSRSRLFSVAYGSLTETGFASTAALVEPVSFGAFSLTGEPATLVVSHKLSAAYGSLSETGFPATAALVEPIVVFAAFGLTGEAASLQYGHALPLLYGSITLTGEAAALTKSTPGVAVLSALPGSFIETGEPAAFSRNHRLPATAGSFALTGEPAVLGTPLHLTAAVGSFALTGEPADLRGPIILNAFPVGFSLFGGSSTGALVEPIGFGSIALTGRVVGFGVGAQCSFSAFSLTGGLALRHFAAPFACGTITLTGLASSAALVEPIVDFGVFSVAGGLAWRGVVSACASGAIGVYGKTSFRKFGGLSGFEEFDFTEGAAQLAYGHALSAATGDFSTVGEASTLLRNRTMALMAGSLSLFGQVSANNVGRLGGTPGLGKVQWSRSATPRVNWIS